MTSDGSSAWLRVERVVVKVKVMGGESGGGEGDGEVGGESGGGEGGVWEEWWW